MAETARLQQPKNLKAKAPNYRLRRLLGINVLLDDAAQRCVHGGVGALVALGNRLNGQERTQPCLHLGFFQALLEALVGQQQCHENGEGGQHFLPAIREAKEVQGDAVRYIRRLPIRKSQDDLLALPRAVEAFGFEVCGVKHKELKV